MREEELGLAKMQQDRLSCIGTPDQEAAKADLALRIWRQSRQELYLSMRFLDLALCSFHFVPDAGTLFAGTDGDAIYYRFDYVASIYRENPILLNRLYLHMVLHCIYRHLFRRGKREEFLWNLACDIAVEYVMDGLNCHPVDLSVRTGRQQEAGRAAMSRAGSGLRRDIYAKLKSGLRVMTAEGIYRRLRQLELSERSLELLAEEFLADDHGYWKQKNQSQSASNQKKWDDISQRTQTSMETYSNEQSKERGSMLETVQVSNRCRYDYREFLRKFAVLKEEVQIDADSFDPIFYTFGLQMYGNLPLVEPTEFKEVRRVEEFVIAVDTSQSTSGELVRSFLEETYGVLKESESFFKKVKVHILQCDMQVQSDVLIRCAEDLREYMEHFELKGGGGTDFRPVFEYVNRLQDSGELRELKGLLYFTDGEGEFPRKRPNYETAFLFLNEQKPEVKLPPWAMSIVIEEEELEGRNEH